MTQLIEELNDDQLDGLAKLCFDIAKASVILALLPTQTDSASLVTLVIKVLVGLFWGLVFVYFALLLLKRKHQDKL